MYRLGAEGFSFLLGYLVPPFSLHIRHTSRLFRAALVLYGVETLEGQYWAGWKIPWTVLFSMILGSASGPGHHLLSLFFFSFFFSSSPSSSVFVSRKCICLKSHLTLCYGHGSYVKRN